MNEPGGGTAAVASKAQAPIRVVVVEDSLVQRAHLVRTLEADGDIVVVGQAVGADEAVALVERLAPDVITLDLHIPGGHVYGEGGQYAIERIMATRPTAILVLSSKVSDRGASPAIEAIAAGALEAIPKPDRWTSEREAEVRRHVRILRRVPVLRRARQRFAAPMAVVPAARVGEKPISVAAIAASTGGPSALGEVLSGLAGINAAVLVIQHIHPDFVDGLVAWMQRIAPIPVRLASHGERFVPGVIYMGPGGLHLKVGPQRTVMLDPEPESRHRPSANELFFSVAEHIGANAAGVILTGIGDDGAEGLLALRRRGGLTMAQDEATSAVYGMPQAAQALGAVTRVLPVSDIAAVLVSASRGGRS